MRRTSPGEPVRRGETAERYELRDGDCGGSDCGAPRYRAEIRETAPKARLNSDGWYGWSFRNETIPGFSADNALRVVVGQWKLPGDAPAAIRLVQTGSGEATGRGCDPAVCSPSARSSADVAVQLPDIAAARNWGDAQNGGHICRLFDMTESRGRWVDIVMNTNFATDDAGYLRIWVDGALRCDYRGPIVATVPGGASAPEHRRGIFVSYTERWDRSFPDRPKPTLVAYYDEFRFGTARGEVDTRALEVAGQPPLD
ncbi:heparin lyase I family protein [Halovulum sp. GXIMD14794]